MRRLWVAPILLIVLVAFSNAISITSRGESAVIRGDYVEVRTASVFAGACHYNGEVTTTGRDALMAWNVKSGQWRGVDLAGVNVVAIITADSNLSDNDAARSSEIVIGSNASDAQSRAILEALKNRYASSFGKVVSVRQAPLTFEHAGKAYSVTANNVASINVEAMPNDLCCKMPNLVWYSTLYCVNFLLKCL